MQSLLPLIEHEVEQVQIYQRFSDGYVNATAMCKAAGKEFSDYKKLVTTKAYVNELSSALTIPQDGLIDSIVGGVPQMQGTWVHPQVAIHLAQWLSPKFAVLVSKWVFDWMTGKIQHSSLPYHLRRYIANRSEIPYTHFSVLNELIFLIVAPMEVEGYVLPENLVPDISQGRMFCKWLRDEKGIDTDSLPTYSHRYEDGRVCQAKMYPNELLDDFRKYVSQRWIPDRAHKYFEEKDPTALQYLPKLISDLAPLPELE